MHQYAGIEQMDGASAVRRGVQKILELQGWLTEQRLGALLFERCQASQQGL